MVTIFFHLAPGQPKTSRPPGRFLGCSLRHLPVHLVSRQVLPHSATPKLYSTSTPPSLQPSPGTLAVRRVLNPYSSFHSNCLLQDDRRYWVDASNILNGGGRLAIVQANQHSGDAPLRRPKFDRSTLLASTPLQSLHFLAQSIDFGIVLRMAFLQLLHRSSRVRDGLNNFSRFVSLSMHADTEVMQ